MPTPTSLDFTRPITIAEGVHWVGFYDRDAGLHCNPYLVVDGGEAVLIDGGSLPDFPVVLTKILQTGIHPGAIRALVYQHIDPDLCGSMARFEEGMRLNKICSDKLAEAESKIEMLVKRADGTLEWADYNPKPNGAQ